MRDQVAYRVEMIENAEEQESGLMTTWDLHILLRNARKLKWPQSVIKPLFYKHGRIEPIPEHYKLVGKIGGVFPDKNAFGFETDRKISVGDRVAVKTGVEFEELDVTSIQVNNTACTSAEPGSKCGIATELASKLKERMEVYLISAEIGS